jgi:hypothetical protein
MRRLAVTFACLLAVAAPPAAAASLLHEAAQKLDGRWQGDGYEIVIDGERDQASTDPARPFQWQRFLVKQVEGDEIVFTVGAELFQARLDADRLTLTSTGFRGERSLTRLVPPEEMDFTLRGTIPAGPGGGGAEGGAAGKP